MVYAVYFLFCIKLSMSTFFTFVGDDVLGVPKKQKIIANRDGRFVNRPYEI